MKGKAVTNSNKRDMMELATEIYELVGGPFDIGDPRQLGEVLFDMIELPGGVRQEDGTWGVSSRFLERIEEDGHPIVSLVLDWRWGQIVRDLLDEAGGKPWAFVGFIQGYITEHGDYLVKRSDESASSASDVLAEIAKSALANDEAAMHEAMMTLRKKAQPDTGARGIGPKPH